MGDPRIDPNYRGVKCKGCGEYLPFLFNRLCTHCALEAKDAEIERLRADTQTANDAWDELAIRNAKLQAVVDAAKKMRAEYDAADDYHSAGCTNWAACEVATYQCGSCDLRESLAALYGEGK